MRKPRLELSLDGLSATDRLAEDVEAAESDCIDWLRCLFRPVAGDSSGESSAFNVGRERPEDRGSGMSAMSSEVRELKNDRPHFIEEQ